MKARILVLGLFACAALLFVWPAAFAAPVPFAAAALITTSQGLRYVQ